MAFLLGNIFDTLTEFFKLGEQLSPAMLQLIDAAIPADKQREMTIRLRRCKRYCRHNKLSYNSIHTTVNLLFKDLSVSDDNGIAELMCEELNVKPSIS